MTGFTIAITLYTQPYLSELLDLVPIPFYAQLFILVLAGLDFIISMIMDHYFFPRWMSQMGSIGYTLQRWIYYMKSGCRGEGYIPLNDHRSSSIHDIRNGSSSSSGRRRRDYVRNREDNNSNNNNRSDFSYLSSSSLENGYYDGEGKTIIRPREGETEKKAGEEEEEEETEEEKNNFQRSRDNINDYEEKKKKKRKLYKQYLEAMN